MRDHAIHLHFLLRLQKTQVSLLQTVTVVVVTPGQQNPSIGTGTGNIINKGLTSDAVGGVSVLCLCDGVSLPDMFVYYVQTQWQVAQTGHNPGSLFYKVGVWSLFSGLRVFLGSVE